MLTVRYGPGADQIGDLYLPEAPGAPLICLFHGGFWKMPWGRDQLDQVSADLCARGFAVWNLEYHRAGPGVSGWPGTFDDVNAILHHLTSLRESHQQAGARHVFFAGHSAGGHLAFWAGSRPRGDRTNRAVIGLAPLLDLAVAQALGLGKEAVASFLGGDPTAVPDRYQFASPRALLPLGVRQRVIHGDADDAVPIHLSHAYVEAARQAGDDATCLTLPGTDHMAFLDPQSAAHEALCRTLHELTRGD